MSHIVLSDQERRVLCAAVDLAVQACTTFGENGAQQATNATVLTELRARLDPDREQFEDLSRPQELAADAMASEFGRSRVRRLSDGAVVVVGMTDDVERAQRCIERDGRERWRS